LIGIGLSMLITRSVDDISVASAEQQSAAAAAESLKMQAEQRVQSVAVFSLWPAPRRPLSGGR